jgi:glycosyltransferase involved in cell wall biosynthesis
MSPSRPLVTHIITSLDTGGAEESLCKLVTATLDHFDHRVISFGAPSDLSERIVRAGAHVDSLDAGNSGPLALWRAWRLMRAVPSDLVQGWMYHGNLLGSLLRRLTTPRVPLAWNVRHSPSDFVRERWTIRWSIRLARAFTPDLVIYNSHMGQAVHADLGYGRLPSVVIPNGVDTGRFRPDPEARERLRSAHAAHASGSWVGVVCRLHPDKGVDVFLSALAVLRARGLSVQPVLAGPGMDRENTVLTAMISDAGLDPADVLYLGTLGDPAAVLPAFDVLAVPSRTEGMPNILLEALACGVPAVATDVGDVACVLRARERLAQADDAGDLADKLEHALGASGVQHGDRAFVKEAYGLAACAEAYRTTYSGLLDAS